MILHILKSIDKILGQIALGIIFAYQKTISPDKGLFSYIFRGRICMHDPHCSRYSRLCMKRYGFFSSISKISHRVFSCTGGYHKIYDPHYYKVVFFSSAPIGVPFLEKLNNDNRFQITGVVTMPDAPSGRGMKIQENIIKSTAKQTLKKSNKILIIHGFYSKGDDMRLGDIKTKLENLGYDVLSPDLPSTQLPILQEQLDYLISHTRGRIDEDTIIIGHSLGGLLLRHFVNSLNIHIKNTISIAPATPGKDYEHIKHKDPYKQSRGHLDRYVNREKIDNEKFNDLVQNNFIIISQDDPAIKYEMAKEYSEYHFPQANIIEYQDKGHFNQEYFDELIDIIETISDPIQTPMSLRKDSKKHSEEAARFENRLKRQNPDFIVVIAYGKIIPQNILDIAKLSPINVHGSILPKYRGASPIQSVLLNNETHTGITIMKMDAGLDTGDIIDIKPFKIHRNRTAKDIIQAMQKTGPSFLNKTLRNFGKGLLGNIKQDETKSTSCGKINKEDGEIDIEKITLQETFNKYRAYILRPKIYFIQNNKRIIIEQLVLDEELYKKHKDQTFSQGGKLNKAIISCILKPEGKKSQTRKDRQNGRKNQNLK